MPATHFNRICAVFLRVGLVVTLFSTLLYSYAAANNASKTPSKQQTKAPFWTSDSGAHTVPATDIPILSSPPLSKEDRTLVRWCLARYGFWGVASEQEAAEMSAHKAAKRFFDRMPSAEIARRLTPIRKALYRGTRAYTSVSFVLAYYGIDFEKNALRVVESIHLMKHTPAKLQEAGFKPQGQDPYGAQGVAGAVKTLYSRNHSAPLMRAYLRAPVDGFMAEDSLDTIGKLFLKYPGRLLVAASSPDDMKSLAECAYSVSGDWAKSNKPRRYPKVRRIIHNLEQSSDLNTARLAKRFRRVYAIEVAQH